LIADSLNGRISEMVEKDSVSCFLTDSKAESFFTLPVV